jgi:mono/diheme cytochrome c family protein
MSIHDFGSAAARLASQAARRVLPAAFMTLAAATGSPPAGAADREQVERGKYLVTLGNCTDCHTPGHFLGKPDMTRHLGGSEVGFEIPGLGVFYGPNLTPDEATGLGRWSERDIVTAIRTGKRPDGRTLAPIMPWAAFAKLTDPDAAAIAAYLKSLPPVSNKAPGPFAPGEAPTSFVMKIVPPAEQ